MKVEWNPTDLNPALRAHKAHKRDLSLNAQIVIHTASASLWVDVAHSSTVVLVMI